MRTTARPSPLRHRGPPHPLPNRRRSSESVGGSKTRRSSVVSSQDSRAQFTPDDFSAVVRGPFDLLERWPNSLNADRPLRSTCRSEPDGPPSTLPRRSAHTGGSRQVRGSGAFSALPKAAAQGRASSLAQRSFASGAFVHHLDGLPSKRAGHPRPTFPFSMSSMIRARRSRVTHLELRPFLEHFQLTSGDEFDEILNRSSVTRQAGSDHHEAPRSAPQAVHLGPS